MEENTIPEEETTEEGAEDTEVPAGDVDESPAEPVVSEDEEEENDEE